MRFNFSVRNGKRWNPHAVFTLVFFSPGSLRFQRRDARKGTSRKPASVPSPERLAAESIFDTNPEIQFLFFSFPRRLRAISTARLNMSPCLHLRPINVVVCDGPWRDLILESASCLDAFSTYPAQTPLPGRAPARNNRYTGGLSSTVLSY